MTTTLIGLLGIVVAWSIVQSQHLSDAKVLALFVFIPASMMAAFEVLILRVHRRAATGLDFRELNGWRESLRRTFIKSSAYWIAWAGAAIYYWLLKDFPYAQSSTYYNFLTLILPWALLITPFYVYFIDRRQVDPFDNSWHFSSYIFGLRGSSEWARAREFIISHALRAFFLPPLVGSLIYYFKASNALTFSMAVESPFTLFYWYFDKLYMIDVVFGVIGYLICSRALDTHIRAVYKNPMSFIVTMVCYFPYNAVFFTPVAFYQGGRQWDSLIPVDSALGLIWMATICVFFSIVILSNISFGLRFSNITDRGVNTSGPYAYFKHPAYFCKNVAWWFMFVPFIATNGPIETLRSCGLMCFLSFIYYARAKCEERELMHLPKYREYVLYIGVNGAIARFERMLARCFGLQKRQA